MFWSWFLTGAMLSTFNVACSAAFYAAISNEGSVAIKPLALWGRFIVSMYEPIDSKYPMAFDPPFGINSDLPYNKPQPGNPYKSADEHLNPGDMWLDANDSQWNYDVSGTEDIKDHNSKDGINSIPVDNIPTIDITKSESMITPVLFSTTDVNKFTRGHYKDVNEYVVGRILGLPGDTYTADASLFSGSLKCKGGVIPDSTQYNTSLPPGYYAQYSTFGDTDIMRPILAPATKTSHWVPMVNTAVSDNPFFPPPLADANHLADYYVNQLEWPAIKFGSDISNAPANNQFNVRFTEDVETQEDAEKYIARYCGDHPTMLVPWQLPVGFRKDVVNNKLVIHEP